MGAVSSCMTHLEKDLLGNGGSSSFPLFSWPCMQGPRADEPCAICPLLQTSFCQCHRFWSEMLPASFRRSKKVVCELTLCQRLLDTGVWHNIGIDHVDDCSWAVAEKKKPKPSQKPQAHHSFLGSDCSHTLTVPTVFACRYRHLCYLVPVKVAAPKFAILHHASKLAFHSCIPGGPVSWSPPRHCRSAKGKCSRVWEEKGLVVRPLHILHVFMKKVGKKP